MIPTYERYAACGGELSIQDYDRLVGSAAALVDYLIYPNVADCADRAYVHAIFAVVESFAENGDGDYAGFQIGGFRVNDQTSTGRELAEEAAKRYLVPAGLMFMGVQ